MNNIKKLYISFFLAACFFLNQGANAAQIYDSVQNSSSSNNITWGDTSYSEIFTDEERFNVISQALDQFEGKAQQSPPARDDVFTDPVLENDPVPVERSDTSKGFSNRQNSNVDVSQMGDDDLLKMVSGDKGSFGSNAGPSLVSNSKDSSQSSELALFEEIPMVITPGKKLQKITESPASVYVITADDIKQSGALNLYDVLRQVPGLDVVASTIGQADVSMRGFSDLGSNKTLLLVDGRSVYLPLQGLQFFEQIPVQMEEIERIEVVKGPVASLYGANANLGLINIITKRPKQMLGGTYSRTGGTNQARRDAIMYAGEKGKLSYKVSSGWKQMNSFNNERDKEAIRGGQLNTELDYAIDEDTNFSLSAGVTHGDIYFLLSQILLKEEEALFGPVRSTNGYLKADYEKGNLKSRIYWGYSDSVWNTGPLTITSLLNSIDYESRYQIDTSENNSIIFGGGSHFDNAKSNIFSIADRRTNTQLLWDGFIQDDYKFAEKWKLSSSVRFDKYPSFDLTPSSRLALMYYPNNEDLYRISGGYSFRNPTLTEQYVNLQVPLVFFFNLPVGFLGNSLLQQEIYTTYEFDYEGHRMDGRLRPFVNLYFTEIRGLVYIAPNGGGGLGLDQQFINAGKAYSAGGEVGTEYDFNRQFTLIGNYAFNNVDYDNSTLREHYHPKHKFTTGLLMKFFNDRLKTKITGHYVSSSEISFGKIPLLAQPPKLQNYMTGDIWVGYNVTDRVEVSVAGLNFTNNVHQEIPGGDDVGSQFLGKLLITF